MHRIRLMTIAVTLAAMVSPAHAKWLRADSNNFIIYGESSERELRDFAEKLERFDAMHQGRSRLRL